LWSQGCLLQLSFCGLHRRDLSSVQTLKRSSRLFECSVTVFFLAGGQGCFTPVRWADWQSAAAVAAVAPVVFGAGGAVAATCRVLVILVNFTLITEAYRHINMIKAGIDGSTVPGCSAVLQRILRPSQAPRKMSIVQSTGVVLCPEEWAAWGHVGNKHSGKT
jgi:hypothetical protein